MPRCALILMLLALWLACSGLAGLVDGAGRSWGLAWAASDPRRSGLEPPGGPRPLDALPAGKMNRTPEGGMGFTDAYGNTIKDVPQEEAAPRKRPHPGAYGGYGAKPETRPLPEPKGASSTPIWSFN